MSKGLSLHFVARMHVAAVHTETLFKRPTVLLRDTHCRDTFGDADTWGGRDVIHQQ